MRSHDRRTLDDAASLRYLAQWLTARRGKLTSTVSEAVIHWRSDPGLPAPDFQIYFVPVYFWASRGCLGDAAHYLRQHKRAHLHDRGALRRTDHERTVIIEQGRARR